MFFPLSYSLGRVGMQGKLNSYCHGFSPLTFTFFHLAFEYGGKTITIFPLRSLLSLHVGMERKFNSGSHFFFSYVHSFFTSRSNRVGKTELFFLYVQFFLFSLKHKRYVSVLAHFLFFHVRNWNGRETKLLSSSHFPFT